MKKTQKKGWYAVFTVAILIVIGALGALCWYLYGMYTSGKEYDGLTISVPSSSSAVPEKETDDKSSRSVISEVSSTDTTDEETKRKKKNNTSKKDEDVINGNVNFSDCGRSTPMFMLG